MAKPKQDLRFDVPVIGPGTIAAMRLAGATLLGVESGLTLLLKREACLAAADAAGIAVIGQPGEARMRPSMPEPLTIGVVGCGVFGRHHARVLSQAPGAQLVGVFDTDPERAQALAHEFRTRAFASLDELERTAAAAVVAAPTVAHAEVAIRLLDAGLDVLVEKPIAPSLAEADRRDHRRRPRPLILMVGHLERFNPAVRLIRARLTRPLFFEVHRLSLFTPRSLDVDVLLDLMIHDLDIVLSFVDFPLADLQAVGLVRVFQPRLRPGNELYYIFEQEIMLVFLFRQRVKNRLVTRDYPIPVPSGGRTTGCLFRCPAPFCKGQSGCRRT